MYDFDTVINRRNSNSLKWDIGENELAMWVADMDFKAAPEITDVLVKRASTGVFGYTIVPQEWTQAIQRWWARRHHFAMQSKWIIFCTGVIPAVTCAVKRMTNHGDNVVVQTPAYGTFFHSIENTGRHVLENPLQYDGTEYQMDWEDLEEKLARPTTTMMIFCNPQNPTGKIWSVEELQRIGELCEQYHVVVLSDEIHCDLTLPGCEYMPYAAASEKCANNSITCISTSKTFNLAGLQSAAVVIPDEAIREKMNRGLNSDEVAEPNAFAIDGVIAAYTQGEAWLDELREYIAANKKTVEQFIAQKLPKLHVIKAEATYLMWIDCGRITDDATEMGSFIRKETGLFLSDGEEFRGNGRQFLRMNVACPREQVMDALARLKKGVEAYEDWKNDSISGN